MKIVFIAFISASMSSPKNDQDIGGEYAKNNESPKHKFLEYTKPETSNGNAPQKLNPTLETNGFLDALGPVIVNSDGTLARITDWQKLR